eukprot:13016470-Alexandrium_andersonii.AAC.1
MRQDSLLHIAERPDCGARGIRRHSLPLPRHKAMPTQAGGRQELPRARSQAREAQGPDRAASGGG